MPDQTTPRLKADSVEVVWGIQPNPKAIQRDKVGLDNVTSITIIRYGENVLTTRVEDAGHERVYSYRNADRVSWVPEGAL